MKWSSAVGRRLAMSLLSAAVCGAWPAGAAVAPPGASAIGPGSHVGEYRTNPRDGATMMWVPAGEFAMGSVDNGQASEDEVPQHRVYLDGYWIYRTEVTVAQYRVFCGQTNRPMPAKPRFDLREDCPMVNVSWEDATAYADWATASLPTEAEWEKAARGSDGRAYPWGNYWDAQACNSGDAGPGRPTPVGSYPAGASPYGCMDMVGNVWEWCQDVYDPKYYQTAPLRNPKGPDGKGARTLRGGSWHSTFPWFLRAALRLGVDQSTGYEVSGFRCVVRVAAQEVQP